MSKLNEIEELLKRYKISKARIIFLESQINRMSDRYEENGRGFNSLVSSLATTAVISGEDEMKHDFVAESFTEYGTVSEIDCKPFLSEMKFELKCLKYTTGLIEDALDILDGLDKKQKAIIERFYIYGNRMEDIAYDIHISRSRCYELCKEALEVLENVVYGSYMGSDYTNNNLTNQISIFDNFRQKLTLTE